MHITAVFFKISNNLHNFLLSAETFLSRLMRLSPFPACGFLSRLGSRALASVLRLIVESYYSLWEHYFINHVCHLRVYTLLSLLSILVIWKQQLLLLNKNESFVESDCIHIIKLSLIEHHVPPYLVVTCAVVRRHYNCLTDVQTACGSMTPAPSIGK